jgi:trans-aconitate methyltransferase
VKDLFESIYRDQIWGVGSGEGSTKEYCEPLVEFLCGYIDDSSVKTLCDIGCGDMQWMPEVVRKTGIKYIGLDCVSSVIESAVASGLGPQFTFIEADVSVCELPDADLYIVKDVLQHWNSDTARDFLRRFFKSRPHADILAVNCNDQTSDSRDICNRTSFSPMSADRYPLSLFNPESLMWWRTKSVCRLRPEGDV